MKTLAAALALAIGAATLLPSIAQAASCGRASSAECSYQRQSESARRAYGNGR